MERADVLIVGGGPAGSSCARALVERGRDVIVLDARPFPRDKPCAGWITPEVVARLELPLPEYAALHTLQPISRFRVGRIGGRAVDVDYAEPVSHAIRRCEFDDWLLGRSGARLRLGERVVDLRREDGVWRVTGRFAAPLLVGAAGHFCPVARRVNGAPPPASTVVAREVEFVLEPAALAACRVEAERPELYFCPDLRGYGWCVRKGRHLNLGLGRTDARALPRQLASFLAWLQREGRIGSVPEAGWQGHAYLLRQGPPRRLAGEAVLLAGDAAGLAFAASGEGILPAVVSGQLAAETVHEALGPKGRRSVDAETLGRRYAERLELELGPRAPGRGPAGPLAALAGAALLFSPWFARRVVLDRWFLHRRPTSRPYNHACPTPAARS